MDQLPAHLNRANRRQLSSQLAGGLAPSTPPYVSIKGGSFTLVDSNGSTQAVPTNYMDCVIVDTNEYASRVYWGENFDPNADTYNRPICFSDNGVGASVNASEPQSTSCAACPQNSWGSAVSKITGKPVKACSTMKKLALLIYSTGQTGEHNIYRGALLTKTPFLLRVPVMSLDKLKAYSAEFKGRNFDVSEVVTRIKFVHGAVGQLEFDALGLVDPDTDRMIDTLLELKRTDTLIGRDDQAIKEMPSDQPPRPLSQMEELRAGALAAPLPSPPVEAPKKRGPKPKAESQAAPGPFAGPQGAPPTAFGGPQQEAPPTAPFLRPNGLAPGNIVQNAPAPEEDIGKTLDSLFNLPTK